MCAYSCSPVTSGWLRKYSRPACHTTGRSSRSRCLTGSPPSTNVRPKSASQASKIGPKSANAMSSAPISRSGGFFRYGCSVFGPARTIRLCQCRSTPNMSAARSRMASLAWTSVTPGRMMPRVPISANSCAALSCASSSLVARTSSSSMRLAMFTP